MQPDLADTSRGSLAAGHGLRRHTCRPHRWSEPEPDRRRRSHRSAARAATSPLEVTLVNASTRTSCCGAPPRRTPASRPPRRQPHPARAWSRPPADLVTRTSRLFLALSSESAQLAIESVARFSWRDPHAHCSSCRPGISHPGPRPRRPGARRSGDPRPSSLRPHRTRPDRRLTTCGFDDSYRTAARDPLAPARTPRCPRDLVQPTRRADRADRLQADAYLAPTHRQRRRPR